MKILILALLVPTIHFSQTTRLNLHENWQLAETGTTEWLPAPVPGTVHQALLANGKIEDPFYGMNEKSVQWVEEKDWVYETTFEADEKLLGEEHVELVFEGLDTYARVFVNGFPVFTADNMFRRWWTDVKLHLRPGPNKLRVEFASPVKFAETAYDTLGYELPAGNDQGAKKVSVFTRKAPFHYGWDWGPRIVTSGIYRPVYLEAWSDLKLRSAQIYQKEIKPGKAVLHAEFSIESDTFQQAALEVRDRITGEVFATLHRALEPHLEVINLDFEIKRPVFWWPNGMGAQHLYDLEMRVTGKNSGKDAKTRRIGLRTIELVREKDATGHSFYFKVNGTAVFMKGANYIPQHHFIPKNKREDFEPLLNSAQEAHFNMIRVWGGGIYEADAFYDLCDEKGILVWQDLMFACSMYPGDPAFQRNVRIEVTEQAERLRNHPSLALWCGNNEIDVAWHNWGWQKQFGYTAAQEEKIWLDYQHLFEESIPKILSYTDPGRPYIPTSPLSNWGTPENFNHHNMHYWGVWHGEDAFEEFENNVPRFMSEFGFQSFPEPHTVRSFAGPEDFELESEVMNWHQKSYKGNRLLTKHLKDYYKVPKDFETWLYVQQLVQARGMRMAFEAQRNRRPHCMGTLYWQLNDCWPGPSWSSIDYRGRWKALHYTVRDRFSPVMVTPEINAGDSLILWISSDRYETQEVRLDVRLITPNGKVLEKIKTNLKLNSNASRPYLIADWGEVLRNHDLGHPFVFARVSNRGQVLSEALVETVLPKIDPGPAPDIKVKKHLEGNSLTLEFKSKTLARKIFVSFENDGYGHFSDNYFDLLPGESKKIEWSGEIQNPGKLKYILLNDLEWREIE